MLRGSCLTRCERPSSSLHQAPASIPRSRVSSRLSHQWNRLSATLWMQAPTSGSLAARVLPLAPQRPRTGQPSRCVHSPPRSRTHPAPVVRNDGNAPLVRGKQKLSGQPGLEPGKRSEPSASTALRLLAHGELPRTGLTSPIACPKRKALPTLRPVGVRCARPKTQSVSGATPGMVRCLSSRPVCFWTSILDATLAHAPHGVNWFLEIG